jgi:Domain of unknown function (DUF4189)
MKTHAYLRFALLCFAAGFALSASAGSAVAWDGHGHMVYSWGHPEKEARDRALALCRQRYGKDARILSSSDLTGYCAIAVARKGTGSVVAASLGRRSATESEILAIKKCLKAGGSNPRIMRGWYG